MASQIDLNLQLFWDYKRIYFTYYLYFEEECVKKKSLFNYTAIFSIFLVYCAAIAACSCQASSNAE